MKFNCLLTNPPFQDSSHDEKKNTLWRKWLQFNDLLVEDKGIFSLVIPSSWMGSPPVLKEYFFVNNQLKENITHINRDECRKHFPSIGSTFSYFVLEKKEYKNKTEIISKNIDKTCDVSRDVNLNQCIIEVFPRDLSEIGLSIMTKTLNNGKNKLGIINNTYNHSVHKKKWSKEPSDEFRYPIQNTPSKLYWYNYAHPDQDKLKLLIPTTTYFRKQMVTTNGVTQSFCYFLIGETLNSEIVVNNVNNKLFDYLNECFRYANWNSVKLLRKLPEIPLDRILNDDEIYEFFGLTDNEIKHINKMITWR
jgi:hypothetical protein